MGMKLGKTLMTGVLWSQQFRDASFLYPNSTKSARMYKHLLASYLILLFDENYVQMVCGFYLARSNDQL